MGFGGIGEMMFILLLGLLLFGPKKLPEIARQVGKVLGEFKKASAEFQAQLNDEVRRLETSVQDNNTNTIAPQGTAPRNETPQYALEPNSGSHEGDVPAEFNGLAVSNGTYEESGLSPSPEESLATQDVRPDHPSSEHLEPKDTHGS